MELSKCLLLCAMFNYVSASLVHGIYPENEPKTGRTDMILDRKGCVTPPMCYCEAASSVRSTLKVDCSSRNLTHVPHNIPANTEILLLKNNKIKELSNHTFQNLTSLKWLFLDYNRIDNVEINAFSGLGNLLILSTLGNRIKYTKSWSLALKPLKNLEELLINQNLTKWNGDEMFPTEAVSNMKNLTALYCDGFPQTGLNMLVKLKQISYLGTYGDRCNIPMLTVNMFAPLVNLVVIQLHKCNIVYIEHGILTTLKHLFTLELNSNHDMGFKVLRNLSYGIWNTSLSELELGDIHPIPGECTKLTSWDLEHFKRSKLKIVKLDSNRLSWIDEDAVDFIPMTISKLNLNNNIMLYGNYIRMIIDRHVLENVEILYLSYQRISRQFRYNVDVDETFQQFVDTYGGSRNQTSEGTYDNCSVCKPFPNHIPISLPVNLEQLYIRESNIYFDLSELCFCNPNKLLAIFIDGNNIRSLKGRFPGLSSLNILDISDNGCENINGDTFRDLPNLTWLQAWNNYLGFSLASDVNGSIFSWLSSLEVLSLRNNKIRFLPRDIFKGLISIKSLDLSENQLTLLDFNIAALSEMTTLLMNVNDIEYVSKDVREHLDTISNKHAVSINLYRNNLKCNCDTKYFVAWIRQTRVTLMDFEKYTCKVSNGSQVYFKHTDVLKFYLQRSCASYTFVIIASVLCIVFMITVSIIGIVYRYRWDLRYFYYYAKLRMKGYVKVDQNDEVEYDADAFVCYNDLEHDFVFQTLIPELEQTRGIHLCIHERDFVPGNSVTVNMIRAITTSRKTLILLSRCFIESSWCRYEANMARIEGIKTGRNVLCVVKMEDVALKDLPLEFMDIIRNLTYLELPRDEAHMDVFWERLKNAISE